MFSVYIMSYRLKGPIKITLKGKVLFLKRSYNGYIRYTIYDKQKTEFII